MDDATFEVVRAGLMTAYAGYEYSNDFAAQVIRHAVQAAAHRQPAPDSSGCMCRANAEAGMRAMLPALLRLGGRAAPIPTAALDAAAALAAVGDGAPADEAARMARELAADGTAPTTGDERRRLLDFAAACECMAHWPGDSQWWGAPAVQYVARLATGVSAGSAPAGQAMTVVVAAVAAATIAKFTAIPAASDVELDSDDANAPAVPMISWLVALGMRPGLTAAWLFRARTLSMLANLTAYCTERLHSRQAGSPGFGASRAVIASSIVAEAASRNAIARDRFGPSELLMQHVDRAINAHRDNAAVAVAEFISSHIVFERAAPTAAGLRRVLQRGIATHSWASCETDPPDVRATRLARIATAFDAQIVAEGAAVNPDLDADGALYSDDELMIVLTIAQSFRRFGAGTRMAEDAATVLVPSLEGAPQLFNGFCSALHALVIISRVVGSASETETVADLMGAVDGGALFVPVIAGDDDSADAVLASVGVDRTASDAAFAAAGIDRATEASIVAVETDRTLTVVRAPADMAVRATHACGPDRVAAGAAAAAALACFHTTATGPRAAAGTGAESIRRWRWWPALAAVLQQFPADEFPLRDAILLADPDAAADAPLSPANLFVAAMLAAFADDVIWAGWGAGRVPDCVHQASVKFAAAAKDSPLTRELTSARLAVEIVVADCCSRGAMTNTSGIELCSKVANDLEKIMQAAARL